MINIVYSVVVVTVVVVYNVSIVMSHYVYVLDKL